MHHPIQRGVQWTTVHDARIHHHILLCPNHHCHPSVLKVGVQAIELKPVSFDFLHKCYPYKENYSFIVIVIVGTKHLHFTVYVAVLSRKLQAGRLTSNQRMVSKITLLSDARIFHGRPVLINNNQFVY